MLKCRPSVPWRTRAVWQNIQVARHGPCTGTARSMRGCRQPSAQTKNEDGHRLVTCIWLGPRSLSSNVRGRCKAGSGNDEGDSAARGRLPSGLGPTQNQTLVGWNPPPCQLHLKIGAWHHARVTPGGPTRGRGRSAACAHAPSSSTLRRHASVSLRRDACSNRPGGRRTLGPGTGRASC